MALYEHMFLARQDIAPQQIDELLNVYKGVIETHGGKVGRVENWGLRPLAYRIRKNRKAYYVLVNIDAPAAAIAEVERQMRINEDILRYMTIRVEKHEKEKSIAFSRLDRNNHIGQDEERSRSSRHQREDAIEGIE
ncbi:30S ribosomal protein S6 [Bartonella pachyuromydis]|uniref:Small ribosomal subunit protein bS6 n=1 Tax=Bartonella pachyuromydis TaxID=931097 RepID=A0ABP8VCB2_9HYPH